MQVQEYSATEIKSAIVGRGRADKRQIQHMVRVLQAVSVASEILQKVDGDVEADDESLVFIGEDLLQKSAADFLLAPDSICIRQWACENKNQKRFSRKFSSLPGHCPSGV